MRETNFRVRIVTSNETILMKTLRLQLRTKIRQSLTISLEQTLTGLLTQTGPNLIKRLSTYLGA